MLLRQQQPVNDQQNWSFRCMRTMQMQLNSVLPIKGLLTILRNEVIVANILSDVAVLTSIGTA